MAEGASFATQMAIKTSIGAIGGGLGSAMGEFMEESFAGKGYSGKDILMSGVTGAAVGAGSAALGSLLSDTERGQKLTSKVSDKAKSLFTRDGQDVAQAAVESSSFKHAIKNLPWAKIGTHGGKAAMKLGSKFASVGAKANVETGEEKPWVLKDLRKTAATYYDQHVPESSVEILGHSAGGITYRHYAHRAPLAFKAITTMPQPSAFRGLAKGYDGQCPCCRRLFPDAG